MASIGGSSWKDPCLAYKVWSNYSGGLRCGSLRAKSIARHGRVDRRAHGHPVLKRRYCVAFSEAQPIGAIWVGLSAPRYACILRAARQTAWAAALPCSRRWSDLEKKFSRKGGRGRSEPLARQGCVERGILGVGSRRLPENQLGEFKRFKTIVALACCPASLV